MGVSTSNLPRKPVANIALDMSSTNITTAAWVQLSAATALPFGFLEIYNGSTSVLKLGVGSAGNEVVVPYFISPGISAVLVPFDEIVKKGVRLSVRAVDASATTGYLLLNMMS